MRTLISSRQHGTISPHVRMHVQKKLRGRDDLWLHSHNRSRLMRFGDGTINFSDLKRTHLGFGTVTLPSRQFGAGDRDYFGVPYQQAGGARMRGNEALAVPRAPRDPQLSANRHWAFLLSFPPNRAPDWYAPLSLSPRLIGYAEA